uniref:ferroxidase n=1 Tax=Eptatretus burgeri TaxID=7764 RepID=A0A8C4Q0D7_EPTBU
MNGYMFGTLSGLEMCKGDRVSWHLLGLGSEADIHSFFIFGNPITRSGRRHDSTSIFPHTSLTLLMEAKAVGDFGIVCRTMTHFTEGMKHRYHVALCGGRLDPPPPHNIPTRRVYLAAVEIDWDYAPSRKWELGRHNMTMEESYGHAFLARGDTTIGSVYKKAVYREYTDETFTERVQRGPKEEHLGILGNTTTYRWFIAEWWGPTENDPDCLTWAYYSTVNPNKDLHSGLIGPVVTCKKGKLHRESGEDEDGDEDDDDDDDDDDDSHQRGGRPGWAQKIRRFRGKGWALGRSIHHQRGLALGHRNPIDRDNIHIRRRWWDLKTLRRSRREARGVVAGADRAFALLFMVFDENHSWYLRENINRFCGTPSAVDMEDEDFMESNKMHGINGLMYGNLHGLVMHAGENVDWYLLGMGDEIDIHTAHFHGQGFTYQVLGHAHRADVFDLFPLTFETVRMVPENVGSWLLHCHVADHIHGGMETVYTVLEGQHAE